jgi:hypothetical protein
VKIISWNLLHSIGATLEEVVYLVEREHPDLFLMQEATAAMDHLPARIGGHYARNPLPGRLHGLAAWSPYPSPRRRTRSPCSQACSSSGSARSWLWRTSPSPMCTCRMAS